MFIRLDNYINSWVDRNFKHKHDSSKNITTYKIMMILRKEEGIKNISMADVNNLMTNHGFRHSIENKDNWYWCVDFTRKHIIV